MNNSVFEKTMENVRKHREIKLVTTEKRRAKLVSEPDYHTTVVQVRGGGGGGRQLKNHEINNPNLLNY